MLASPARFERATYTLEALKMRLKNSRTMTLRSWLLVWHRHRELWFGVGLGGSLLASAGGQMV
jgi:hypothetical protein